MRPVSEFQNRQIKLLFTDIDDTLTDEGRLRPVAYQALWDLHQAGIQVVPVTGRPAGWCELIARQWPVAGVVGENGGFYFRLADNVMEREFLVPESTQQENRKKLEQIKEEVLKSVPGTAIASDQFCRLLDLAIDFKEDVPPLASSEVSKIVGIFEKHGATAKVSSIHVNGWFGDYDKLSMCQIFARNALGLELKDHQNQIAFVGDSPNDEPMFSFFENSFAVANIDEFQDQLTDLPTFKAQKKGGSGFSEIATQILKANT